MFSKNIRILYLYVVSFLSLMAIIIGTVTLVERVTNYVYPVDYTYNETYLKNYDESVSNDMYNYNNNIAELRENAQRQTLRDIFTAFAVIIVAVPLYSYHWSLIQKERKNE